MSRHDSTFAARDSATTEEYFKSIGQFDRVTPAQEIELAREWQEKKSAKARDRLITANLRLVIALARRSAGRGVPMDDLIAEGNVGLIHAVENFDPDAGCRFSTYAVFWIRQSIGRAFMKGTARGSLNRPDRKALTELEAAATSFAAREGRPPSERELADLLGWSVGRVCDTMSLTSAPSAPKSLEVVEATQPTQLAGTMDSHDDADAERQAVLADVENLLGVLTEAERHVVELLFGLHGQNACSVDEAAAVLGRTTREVLALKRTAVTKMARQGRPLPSRAAGTPRSSEIRIPAHVRAGAA